MGTSFVSLGRDRHGEIPSDVKQEVGFWMEDSVLQLWLRLLALHVEEPAEEAAVATGIRNQWLFASRYGFPGCVPHCMNEATATPEGFAIVRNAVHSLTGVLENMTAPLSRHALQLMAFEGVSWNKDIDVAILRDVAVGFVELLEFRIESTASSTNRMPGSDSLPQFH